MNHFFQKAKPVFIEGAAEPYNQFAGFRSDVWVEAPGVLKIAVTARLVRRMAMCAWMSWKFRWKRPA